MKESRRALVLLVVLCGVPRLLLWLARDPIVAPDTHGYERFARQIWNWDLTGYDGWRTPLYPVFMVLGGINFRTIAFLQAVTGVAIAVLLFRTALKDIQNARWALLVAATGALALNQLSFEIAILSESLAAFFLVLSMAQFARVYFTPRRSRAAFFGLGCIVTLAIMTRPALIVLAPLYLVALCLSALGDADGFAEKLARVSIYTATAFLPILCWSWFNYVTLGYFGPTTMTGIHLTNHSGAFIELAPEEYSDVRDIYLEFRGPRIRATGSHTVTIWDAQKVMQERLGLTYAQLSKRLTAMSVRLFVAHPLLYARGVTEAAADFWRVPNPCPLTEDPFWSRLLKGFWLVQRVALFLANLAFFFLAGRCTYRLASGKSPRELGLELWIVVIVLGGCIGQALTEYGDNARYALPFQCLVVYAVLVALGRRSRVQSFALR